MTRTNTNHGNGVDKLKRRMDRLDSVVHEYLRSNRKTVQYLSDIVGCAPSTLWRYCKKMECFQKIPLCILAKIFRMVNISNEDLRYILGLPTGGKIDDK